jgi:hypothetical protein
MILIAAAMLGWMNLCLFTTRMKRIFSTLLALAGFVELVTAAEPAYASACMTLATNYVYDNCSSSDELYYDCRCASPQFLGSRQFALASTAMATGGIGLMKISVNYTA